MLSVLFFASYLKLQIIKPQLFILHEKIIGIQKQLYEYMKKFLTDILTKLNKYDDKTNGLILKWIS